MSYGALSVVSANDQLQTRSTIQSAVKVSEEAKQSLVVIQINSKLERFLSDLVYASVVQRDKVVTSFMADERDQSV